MITVNNVSLRFGTKTLFQDVNLKFVDGACYGLIGANGSGKSTFLKLLNGELDTTTGDIIIPKNERVSTLEQDHYKYDEFRAIDVVIMGNKKLYDIKVEKEELYSHTEFTDADGIRLGELEAEFMELNGWEAESEASILLSNLGVLNKYHELKMKDLENNDKVKVLLAKSLFQNPDILLLDEPTNNLDIEAINWLSEFIIDYPNCCIVVSHDRHFLNNVCTHIVDIDYGKLTLYTGNYDFWRESSELLLKQVKEANRKKEDKIKELKDFIARFQANASKSRQATSRKKILEKIELEEIIPSSRKYPYIDFKFEKGNGKEVLNVENLTVEVDGRKLLNKVSFSVLKGDKIAFLGSNIQKTLLFSVLTKQKKYTSGEFKWGSNVLISYFESDNSEYFNTNINILDWISKYKRIDDLEMLRSFLGRMLFSGDDVFKSVDVLSGGEKARCMLSKMMLDNPNVLILDEPTNHLDLESITSLNTAMKKFQGEILFTSHDYELNETAANRIIEILEDGTIIDRRIPYSEYIKDEKVKKIREKNKKIEKVMQQ
ncbi:MAG: ATP-binding cassette domain-containing protein [Bacilli bacterium]|nr:ATP-binding cassette domain-containing protein [Bacilli bacterium]